MSGTTLHLRAETKPFEHRSFLTPDGARTLIEAGYKINVEHSTMRCFSDAEFEAVGCKLVPEGSWPTIPLDHIVLGLKELPESTNPLSHTHVMWAHVFKFQEGWVPFLLRFFTGGGSLLDIEFLKDTNGKLIGPSGFHAGFCGAALALRAWSHQMVHPDRPMPEIDSYQSEDEMLKDIRLAFLGHGKEMPRCLVMGALGRTGKGAISLFEKAGVPEDKIQVVKWDLKETAGGGPFPEILEHDIMINCIYLQGIIPPFLTSETLNEVGETRKLRVIVDVSCDNTDPHNPIAIYTQHTTFAHPTLRIGTKGGVPLDVIAIDHLPSLLPREASEACCRDLMPALLKLNDWRECEEWKLARELFWEREKLAVEEIANGGRRTGSN